MQMSHHRLQLSSGYHAHGISIRSYLQLQAKFTTTLSELLVVHRGGEHPHSFPFRSTISPITSVSM